MDSCYEYFQDDSLGHKKTDGLRLLVKVCIEVSKTVSDNKRRRRRRNRLIDNR